MKDQGPACFALFSLSLEWLSMLKTRHAKKGGEGMFKGRNDAVQSGVTVIADSVP